MAEIYFVLIPRNYSVSRPSDQYNIFDATSNRVEAHVTAKNINGIVCKLTTDEMNPSYEMPAKYMRPGMRVTIPRLHIEVQIASVEYDEDHGVVIYSLINAVDSTDTHCIRAEHTIIVHQ
jgi:hypothetical protein